MKTGMRVLILAGTVLVLGACSQHQHHQDHHGQHHAGMRPPGAASTPELERFMREMDAGMEKMTHGMHVAGYSGNPDVDFLAMMIPHHEGAVEMARLLLINGKDPLTRRLAEEIIASQTAEITAMKERLSILRRGEDPNPGGFPAIHGTRGVAPR